MYYVKEKINGVEIEIDINDENVYTRCVKGGKEMQIEIVDEIKNNPDFDLYGTGRFCNQECADRYNAPPWKVDGKSVSE